MSRYYNEDELYHFGILGQKWGVRRYENKDGTLTPEGKARYAKYGVSFSPGMSNSKKREPSRDELLRSTNAKEVYKYRDKLNDQELRERVNRIQTEQQLEGLVNNSDRGRKFMNKLDDKIMTLTVAAIAAAIIATGKGSIKSMAAEMSTPVTTVERDPSAMTDYERRFYGV